MFNPFKKKDDEFKLDEESLPSLGDSNFTQQPVDTSPSSLGEMPSMSQSEPPMPNLSNASMADTLNSTLPSLNGGMSSTSSPFDTPAPSSFSQDTQMPTSSHQNDLIKAKLDSIEAKVNLFEAKFSSMEQKIELIYQLLSHEVSDETKRKFSVGQMMNTVRNNQQ